MLSETQSIYVYARPPPLYLHAQIIEYQTGGKAWLTWFMLIRKIPAPSCGYKSNFEKFQKVAFQPHSSVKLNRENYRFRLAVLSI